MTLLTLLQSPTGSGTIGTLSATLGAATLSSNGTLTAGATGTLAVTLGAVTLSSNGTLTASVTGTLSATLGLLTLSAQGVLPGAVPADEGSKGGWDPYAYKRRNKRRAKAQDVQAFVAEVAQADLSDAPPVLVAQAEDALQAAREALALRNAAIEDAATLARALAEINEFYRLVREQVRLRREADDDEDDELLLLH
jgi:hypothetical protein